MKIVDSYGINDGGLIYSVELAENRFVDVKVSAKGSVYIMQNEDGSSVYTGEWTADGTCPGYVFDEKVVLDFVKEAVKKNVGKVRVAIESTDDYSDSAFHSRLVDSDVKNEDGTYGRLVESYRIVSINPNGRIDKFDDRVFASPEAARSAVLNDARLVLVCYDDLVHEAGKGLQAVIADAQARSADCGDNHSNRINEFVKE